MPKKVTPQLILLSEAEGEEIPIKELLGRYREFQNVKSFRVIFNPRLSDFCLTVYDFVEAVDILKCTIGIQLVKVFIRNKTWVDFYPIFASSTNNTNGKTE